MAAEQSEPCSAPEADQFDFWLGDWQLNWGEDGRGTNHISKDYDGCVIYERFDGRPSMKMQGMSVSVYNPHLGAWRQTWVDSQGSYFALLGGMQGDRMILECEVTRNDKVILLRMVFYNIADDSLDWNWERSVDGGQTWELVWQIHYQRMAT